MSDMVLTLPAPPENGDLGPLPQAQIPNSSSATDGDQPQPPSDQRPPASVATHTRTIGIIHPPPDIRTIIDKTAQFVAKNGPEFERRILANNKSAKFSFLTPTDPYHAYYQHRISESRNQQQESPLPSDSDALPTSPSNAPPSDVPPASDAPKPAESAFKLPVRKVLEPPEAEQYTVRLPEGITGEELDIIKLTAQFVARNGREFLTGLASREMNNPQFHFLRPTHSLCTFFMALTDAYSKVLMVKDGDGTVEKLRRGVKDLTMVLERCLHRLEWERSQEQARQKAEDEIEQERVLMAMIDWHDFVVVESIDFLDEEENELPPPLTLEEVIRRSKITPADEDELAAIPSVEPGKEVEMEMDEEEVQLVEEGMRAAKIEDRGQGGEPEPPLRIVKNWKRPEDRLPAERDPTKFVVSPITGELIPISEMAEHMRISLIDPKYKEQKERMMAKIRETTLAQDDEISRNIVGLARTRPDIFGTTEEEVSNAVKAEIEKKKEEQPKQVIWDGHTGSIGRTANQALSQSADADQAVDMSNNGDGMTLPGPAAPPPRPGIPSVRPLPPPPGLALNMPRMPPNALQYGMPPQRPPMMMPSVRPPMPMMGQQQPMMVNRPPMPPSISVNPPSVPIPPPPGSQFTLLGIQPPQPFGSMSMPPPPPPAMQMMPPPPQWMPPPPPPPEEAPPLPEEPEPKKQRLDEISLIPEDQFLAQHPVLRSPSVIGSVRISVSVPNTEEGNLKGQLLEITIQSLSETVGSLKEKIAAEVQLPANKQKLSGRAGFLKDNYTLAYYNIGPNEILILALREHVLLATNLKCPGQTMMALLSDDGSCMKHARGCTSLGQGKLHMDTHVGSFAFYLSDHHASSALSCEDTFEMGIQFSVYSLGLEQVLLD
ncbi:putative splicing factor 3A subunit 1 [Acorus calamus]|uniref:Splicing factor 3A subunit 1 n=1 Tax=Acorus calamus TaxID=4465 RepID=A0AAV9FB33_ACOCL|nr:putative splicing factor 3A subunit 1 [Acorus calamus]